MKCRHEYVRAVWSDDALTIYPTTYTCVACLALGVRSLGETPDPVGWELCVAQTMELFGPECDPFDCGSDEVEWIGPTIEDIASEIAAAGGKLDRLELNPDNVEAAIMAGMDVEVVPVDDTQEDD